MEKRHGNRITTVQSQQDIVANRNRLRAFEDRKSKAKTKKAKKCGKKSFYSKRTEAYFRALDLAETEAKIALLESQAAATAFKQNYNFKSNCQFYYHAGFIMRKYWRVFTSFYLRVHSKNWKWVRGVECLYSE